MLGIQIMNYAYASFVDQASELHASQIHFKQVDDTRQCFLKYVMKLYKEKVEPMITKMKRKDTPLSSILDKTKSTSILPSGFLSVPDAMSSVSPKKKKSVINTRLKLNNFH